MSIARRFIPTTAHTPVREQAAQRLIPCPLVGINILTGVNISDALVPGDARSNLVDGFRRRRTLRVRLHPILMPRNETKFTSSLVEAGDFLSTTASTFNGIHRHGLYHHYRIKDNMNYLLRQMGNAVAVPVAEWLGRRIVAAEMEVNPQ